MTVSCLNAPVAGSKRTLPATGGSSPTAEPRSARIWVSDSKNLPTRAFAVPLAASLSMNGWLKTKTAKITLIGGCINDGVAALLELCDPLKLYVLYFLRTQTERLRSVNQGAAQPNLNTSIIKDICIPLPPLAEQTRIVAEVERRLSVVEELEAVVSANLQRAARLRQSILQKAFTGELTGDATYLRDPQAQHVGS